jgi:hypothetical protein
MITGSEIFSGVALLFSGFSLWHTSLRGPSLAAYVPPNIRYASPYQNSLFEAFEIPLTVVNSGARTGTALSFDLIVINDERRQSKRFYSACFGPWSLEKAHASAFEPFAPMSLAGRTSQSRTLLFYPRKDQTVMQIVPSAGRFRFVLTINMADATMLHPVVDQYLGGGAPAPLTFQMDLPDLDHRAFTSGSGTVTLNNADWRSTGNGRG